ncbi:hypothetical protein [Brytella acorum]|uniref:Uncharacterized protein n=1 Tax=Brytella acorum TaxID=2959299 RepID=A0AA35Y3R6_9PROT|nr:hypothetical protein [Brytella acorum]CAI9120452.1 hypothetical protein LMG32879_001285 [Brytella acorum]
MTVQEQYPARYYARYDHAATQPAPVTGWYDVWGMSDASSVPDAADLVALSAAQWSARTPTGLGVQNGQIVSYAPPAPTLAAQARSALVQAQAATWAKFGSLGKTVTDDWITYQQALSAIADGSNATATDLPSAPSS